MWCFSQWNNVIFPQSHSLTVLCMFQRIYEFVRVWTPSAHLMHDNTKSHDAFKLEFTIAENVNNTCILLNWKKKRGRDKKLKLHIQLPQFHWMNYTEAELYRLESATSAFPVVYQQMWKVCALTQLLNIWRSEPDSSFRYETLFNSICFIIPISHSSHSFRSLFLVQWKPEIFSIFLLKWHIIEGQLSKCNYTHKGQ